MSIFDLDNCISVLEVILLNDLFAFPLLTKAWSENY